MRSTSFAAFSPEGRLAVRLGRHLCGEPYTIAKRRCGESDLTFARSLADLSILLSVFGRRRLTWAIARAANWRGDRESCPAAFAHSRSWRLVSCSALPHRTSHRNVRQETSWLNAVRHS